MAKYSPARPKCVFFVVTARSLSGQLDASQPQARGRGSIALAARTAEPPPHALGSVLAGCTFRYARKSFSKTTESTM
jgi:hypothetical protein